MNSEVIERIKFGLFFAIYRYSQFRTDAQDFGLVHNDVFDFTPHFQCKISNFLNEL